MNLKYSQSGFYGPQLPSNFLTHRIIIPLNNLGTDTTSTITYPYTGLNMTTFVGTPNAIVSLASIQWNKKIKYNLKINSTNTSAVYIDYQMGQNVFKLTLNVLVIDSTLWSYNFQQFQYDQRSAISPGDFSVTNHSNYLLSYLVALTADCLSASASTAYRRTTLVTVYKVLYSYSYNPSDVTIDYLRYFMLSFTQGYQSPYQYRQTGCKISGRITNAIQYSSQNTQLPVSQTSSTNYFYGFHTIKLFTNGGSGNDIVNITSMTVQNSDYLFTNYRILIRCCQFSTPYYQASTGNCVVSCGSGFFVNMVFYCEGCDNRCLTCQNSATTCTSCNTNFTYDSTLNQCLCNGFYNSSNGQCRDCKDFIPYCNACVNDTYCTSCDQSFFLVQNLAIGNCQCPSNNIYTIGTQDFCIISTQAESCQAGMVIQQNRCVCPGLLRLINGVCI